MNTLPSPDHRIDPHLLTYMNRIGHDQDIDSALELVEGLGSTGDTRGLLELETALRFNDTDQTAASWIDGINVCRGAIDEDKNGERESAEDFEPTVEQFLKAVTQDYMAADQKVTTQASIVEHAKDTFAGPRSKEAFAFMSRLNGHGPTSIGTLDALLKQNAALIKDKLWSLVQDGRDYTYLEQQIEPEDAAKNRALWQETAYDEIEELQEQLHLMRGWIAKNK